ncbi:MAG: hypothetical protein R3F62_02715 [Planctomycetota bacterium]
MSFPRLAVGLWLAALAAGAATAQSPPTGSFQATTTYAGGAGTTDTALRIRSDGPGRVKLDRTARYTDAGHASQAPFRWYGLGILVAPTVLRVEYRITASGGISSALSGDDYRFRAFYVVQGDRIREYLSNQTPTGAHQGWTRATSRGTRDDRFVLAARSQAQALVNTVMNYRTDVADYYDWGDEDRYRSDAREAEFFFERALWVEVPALPGQPAFKTLQAINMDRDEVVSPGDAFVTLDADARVLGTFYREEGGELFDSGGFVNPTPVTPAPPAPPVVIDCPLGGATLDQLRAKATAEASSLTRFIMNFRSDIADYYDPGDQAYYDADRQAASAYFRSATWSEVAIPAGYSAYKALRADAADPTDVILGHVTLLFDCTGQVIETVYYTEGETYDSSDS